MDIKIFIILLIIQLGDSIKHKNVANKTVVELKNNLEKHEDALSNGKRKEVNPVKITDVLQPKITAKTKKEKKIIRMISPKSLENWAQKISDVLLDTESRVVKREELLNAFSDVKKETRNGTAIVNKVADILEELLKRRAKAAENIMRKAEELDKDETPPPTNYVFNESVDLDKIKKRYKPPKNNKWEMPLNCTNVDKMSLNESKHFDGKVSLQSSSVYVSLEVFKCDPAVVRHVHWSEGLLSTFQKNYEEDATTDFQYFCSAKGFLRHYPAALWDDMHQLQLNVDDVYDCRLRPWYVSASGAPRDVLILLDASGSLNGSSNQVIAEEFTLALLSALTDDDQVNVLCFNVVVESLISCFNQKLVPANHVNTAAIMEEFKEYIRKNETDMDYVLKYAVRLLRKQRGTKDRPTSCQQAIVMLTDSMYDNYTELMAYVDPGNNIRLFVFWLHDRYGLRDNTRELAEFVSCARDGYFAELITHADVTEQVMNILRVMERPLVQQRQERLQVFSDIYAHIEDPRRSEYHWIQKENAEQLYRYQQLRKDKNKLLESKRMYEDWMHQWSLNEYGQYYEGQDLNYRLEISVSVPVFDATTAENITIQLMEEQERNATREYPVNRLLGVAGVDIPIDHLKLILPYHELGANGALIMVDHRGNIVLHDNMKPTFDGDVLKPGYRTVDFLDMEQSATSHYPRQYPPDWIKLRRNLIIDKESGNMVMYAKDIFEGGMRAILEHREYSWKRILEHYTVIVVLPTTNKEHAVSATKFTRELAEAALKSLSRTEFSVQPDWLYCRHVEPHFDTREAEVLHFIRRRSDEPNFAMKKLNHLFSPIPPALLEKTYQCNEALMASLCKDAITTDQWAREHEHLSGPRECATCDLGSITAFVTTESGLTRWQVYHATSEHASPVEGAAWPHGPREAWYRRAAHRPDTLLIHAPVAPVQRRRNSYIPPPPPTPAERWLTAARALSSPEKGLIGVAGFHFYPKHLDDLLNSITNVPCEEEDESKCEVRCDGAVWMCVLVDEGGWVVSGGGGEVAPHLATLHPAAMAALLNASIFQLNWIHDYQSVCFTKAKNSALTVPSLLKSLWGSISSVFHVAKGLITVLMMMSYGTVVTAETEKERAKRRNRLRYNYEVDRLERLYDVRVLVNRTRFSACDRSRPMYQLQRNAKSMELLGRAPRPCHWGLTGAPLPHTNLLLLALHRDCPHHGTPLPDPLLNQQYSGDVDPELSTASQLACWRNREPLPGRHSHTHCYKHQYEKEEGYRQCGPWIADEEKKQKSSAIHHCPSNAILVVVFILLRICTFVC